MNSSRRVYIFLFFTIFLSCAITTPVMCQGTPDCDCSDIYDVGTPEWLDCEANGCTGVDIPVSGNIWLLAMAGVVFAFVKFGGHTKLAGYYYSKLEKQG
jgi:hypothetical protein